MTLVSEPGPTATGAASPAVRASGLVKAFGPIRAVDGVSFDLAPGRIYGVLGPNGSGKTTLIRLLVGLTGATAGVAEVLGVVMPSRPTLGRIGYMTQVVTGYILGFGLFATLQVILLMTWALASVHVPPVGPLPDFWVGLGIPIAGSAVYAFLVVVLTALGAVSLGIFLSTFARTELQIIQFMPIVLVPQFLLSGVLFPVDSLPPVVQPLTKIMPLTYTVEGLRQVFIAGADLASSALRFALLVLALFAIFFATSPR